MSDVDKWQEKTVWTREGKDFCVEIVRRVVVKPAGDLDTHGPWRWNVYSYVRHTHAMFSQIDQAGDMQQAAFRGMPFHTGCTLFEMMRGDYGGEAWSCARIGADYQHLHDRQYTYIERLLPEGSEIVLDANALFNWLSERNTKESEE